MIIDLILGTVLKMDIDDYLGEDFAIAEAALRDADGIVEVKVGRKILSLVFAVNNGEVLGAVVWSEHPQSWGLDVVVAALSLQNRGGRFLVPPELAGKATLQTGRYYFPKERLTR